MPKIITQTPRLTIQLLEDDDCHSLTSIFRDAEVMRFSLSGLKSKKQILEFITRNKHSYSQHGFGSFAIILRETSQLIGICGISIQELNGTAHYELGYRFAKRYWGNGFASEAAMACKDFAFQSLKLKELISIIDPVNTASIRVAEKIGMTHEKDASFHGISVKVYSIKSK